MTQGATSTRVPAPGPWVERWLSHDRHRVYLREVNGDLGRSLLLYEWNTRLGASLLHDLAHLEVGVRNACDRQLVSKFGARWSQQSMTVLPVRMDRRRLNGRRVGRVEDQNEWARGQLGKTVSNAGGRSADHGKVIADLTFSFWPNLVADYALWVGTLAPAFGPRTTARKVEDELRTLNALRNRVAHHEPLWKNGGLQAQYGTLTTMAQRISPELRQFIQATSSTPRIIGQRP